MRGNVNNLLGVNLGDVALVMTRVRKTDDRVLSHCKGQT